MRNVVLAGLFLLFATLGFAGQVDSIRAKKIAANFFLKRGEKISRNAFHIVPFKAKVRTGLKSSSLSGNALYLIKREGAGFIIISGYDNVQPVLGYSFENINDPDNLPPALKEWINWREAEIELMATSNQVADSRVSNQWEELNNAQITEAITDYSEPLIRTYWGQGVYYNDSCPSDVSSTYSNDKVPSGCVATAMAQIMKYWEFPSTGTGSKTYTPSTHTEYGVQKANFNTSYNWATMSGYALYTDSGKVANTEISKILYHCGVSVGMDYGPDGSSSSASTAITSLKNYFKYKSTASFIARSSYSASAWNNTIRNEIVNYRPVLLRGASADNKSGHAYVCDGYYGTDYFHINWGWDGSYNGYFSFNDLTPGSSNYSYSQSAGIGIVPGTSSCAVYPGSISLSSVSAAASQFWITSNTTWSISCDQAWLNIDVASGTGYSKINISAASANTSGVNRIATITITPNGMSAKTLIVNQLSSTAAISNLLPYKPSGWSDRIVVSKVTGTTTDGTITVNDTVYVDYSFYNNGSADITGMFTTWLVLDDTIVREQLRAAGLPSRFFLTSKDYMLGRLSAGTHTLAFKADALNNILESNENDNMYTRTFTVLNVTSIPENTVGGSVSVEIYPNPVMDLLNIKFGEVSTKKIAIINSGGLRVLQMEAAGEVLQIPVSQLLRGVYLLQVSTDKGLKNFKFVKQ